jgi:hypothetical protein
VLLFRDDRSGNFAGLGAGEFLAPLIEEVSDFAGDGLARTGISNLAGLGAFDGIVAGLSRGDDEEFADEELCCLVVVKFTDAIGDGFMLRPDG